MQFIFFGAEKFLFTLPTFFFLKHRFYNGVGYMIFFSMYGYLHSSFFSLSLLPNFKILNILVVKADQYIFLPIITHIAHIRLNSSTDSFTAQESLLVLKSKTDSSIGRNFKVNSEHFFVSEELECSKKESARKAKYIHICGYIDIHTYIHN